MSKTDIPLVDLDTEDLKNSVSRRYDIFDLIIENAIETDKNFHHVICISLFSNDRRLDSLLELKNYLNKLIQCDCCSESVRVELLGDEVKNIYLDSFICSRNHTFSFSVDGPVDDVRSFCEKLLKNYACISKDDLNIKSNVSRVQSSSKKQTHFFVKFNETNNFLSRLDLIKSKYAKSRQPFNVKVQKNTYTCFNKVKLNKFFVDALKNIHCEKIIKTEIVLDIETKEGLSELFINDLKNKEA